MYPENTRRAWLEEAQALTPALHRTPLRPVSAVRPAPDPDAPQGWRMEDVGAAPAQEARALTAGDGFTVDFGEHVVGYLRFTVESVEGFNDAPVRLQVVAAETPAEVGGPFDPYPGWLSRSWLQDETLNLDVLPAEVTLPRRYAFRYLRFTVVAPGRAFTVRIRNVSCECVSSAPWTLPPPDPTLPADLRELDTVSLRTLRNCTQTVFEDGPKRDRRLWLGDLRLQALTAYASLGGLDLVKRCLLLFAALARPEDGVIPACVYEHPEPRAGHDFIVDYAALFAPTLLDFLAAGGDEATACSLWPVAVRQLEWCLGFVDDSGLFQVPPDQWVFIDWQAGLEKQAPMHGCLVYCLRAAVRLATHLGEDPAALAAAADRMTVAARRGLWDAEQGVFRSGDAGQVSWASQAWMVLAGVPDGPDDARRALRSAAALPGAVRPAGPYGYHHFVDALLRSGLADEALALLRSYWGAMVGAGATTFWEVFDPADLLLSPYESHLVNSYCHAWSCTPAYFLRDHREAFPSAPVVSG